MSKDTFYFSHDYYAMNDPKLLRLKARHGMAGIGAFWCVIEMLYEQGGELSINDIPIIAKELFMQQKTLESIIENFGLFQKTETIFLSLAVNERLLKRNERSASARKSANSRWNSGANAMRTHSERNAIKERKVKESKLNKDIYGKFKNVLLSKDEYTKLIEQFTENITSEKIETLSMYIESKGIKYKSHYATILSWDRKDNGGGNGINQKDNRRNGARLPTVYTEYPNPELSGE
jgi:hypothetical protein